MSGPNIDRLVPAQIAAVRFWAGVLTVSAIASLTLPEHSRLSHLAMIVTTSTLATGALTAKGPAGMRPVLGGCAVGAIIGLLCSIL